MADEHAGEPVLTDKEVGLRWMSYILSRLYEAWPVRIDLDQEEVAEFTDTTAALGQMGEESAVWDGLTHWLIAEGIITTNGQALGGEHYHCQLTSKGYALLNKPVPGSSTVTTAERLKDLASKAGAETVKAGGKTLGTELAEVVGTLIGNAAKPFFS